MTPSRSEGGQRLYSDQDVHRLSLLVRVTDAGRSISQVAGLSTAALEALAAEDIALTPGMGGPGASLVGSAPEVLREAIRLVEDMDAGRLERLLSRSALELDPATMVGEIVVPLLDKIGRMWEDGTIGPANEHLASGVVRRFLEWILSIVDLPADAPVLVCATPRGHRHELGALLCAVVASGAGWRAAFLGPDLPADDVAAAARGLKAAAVAVSAIYPAPDPELSGEIGRLMQSLPSGTPVCVGGRAALGHRAEIEDAGATVAESMDELREWLVAAGVAAAGTLGV